IVNMLLGSLAIAIGMFPPLVFPTPVGTPGILRPLIASGGNWISLLVMMLLLVIDVLIYIPFIQKMEQLEIQEGEK
ncbi:MAG: PTS sugar transporter subunit IIC, partial [Lactobacillus sp.]|nr:PTS sugar transporter subunit IIC [Lactobacillus sp.]